MAWVPGIKKAPVIQPGPGFFMAVSYTPTLYQKPVNLLYQF